MTMNTISPGLLRFARTTGGKAEKKQTAPEGLVLRPKGVLTEENPDASTAFGVKYVLDQLLKRKLPKALAKQLAAAAQKAGVTFDPAAWTKKVAAHGGRLPVEVEKFNAETRLAPDYDADDMIIDTDGYKPSHFLQYPEGTTDMEAYLESRGGKFDKTQFFGLQYILKRYFSKPVTMPMVREMAAEMKEYGVPFNEAGWRKIVTDLKGKIPLEIEGVPEGRVVPTKQALLVARNTVPGYHWVVGWFETQLMRAWYPITVATQSLEIKHRIADALNRTSDHAAAVLPYMLHDFGGRGVTTREAAGIGGLSHLVNWLGSDTMEAIRYAKRWYNAKSVRPRSIPAAEHSTIITGGKNGEVKAFKNMLDKFAKPGAIVAVVSDSYDYYKAVKKHWGETLKGQIVSSGATVVIRPDSGEILKVISDTLDILEKQFGTTTNTKGFKVLNHVKIIQGDGVNLESITQILAMVEKKGFSIENICFGMGGALLQKVDRDTQKFAYKPSAVKIKGQWYGVSKNPKTDPGKKSKMGRLTLVRMEDGKGAWKTLQKVNYTLDRQSGRAVEGNIPFTQRFPHAQQQFIPYYRNGKMLANQDFDTIVRRAEEDFQNPPGAKTARKKAAQKVGVA